MATKANHTIYRALEAGGGACLSCEGPRKPTDWGILSRWLWYSAQVVIPGMIKIQCLIKSMPSIQSLHAFVQILTQLSDNMWMRSCPKYLFTAQRNFWRQYNFCRSPRSELLWIDMVVDSSFLLLHVCPNSYVTQTRISCPRVESSLSELCNRWDNPFQVNLSRSFDDSTDAASSVIDIEVVEPTKKKKCQLTAYSQNMPIKHTR